MVSPGVQWYLNKCENVALAHMEKNAVTLCPWCFSLYLYFSLSFIYICFQNCFLGCPLHLWPFVVSAVKVGTILRNNLQYSCHKVVFWTGIVKIKKRGYHKPQSCQSELGFQLPFCVFLLLSSVLPRLERGGHERNPRADGPQMEQCIKGVHTRHLEDTVFGFLKIYDYRRC